MAWWDKGDQLTEPQPPKPEPSLKKIMHSVNPPQEKAPITIAFDVTVEDGTPKYEYKWNFGDGSNAEGEDKTIEHFYLKGRDSPIKASCAITDFKKLQGTANMEVRVDRQKFEDKTKKGDKTVSEERVQILYATLAPKIREILPDDRGYDLPIELKLESDNNAPASWRKNENKPKEGYIIRYDPDLFKPALRNDFTAGTFAHEFVHVIQCYKKPSNPKYTLPSWLIEGMADYIRAEFEHDFDINGSRGNQEGSYRSTAHFLRFLEKKYPGIIENLHRRMAEKKYSEEDTWKEKTDGKSLAQLENEYMSTSGPDGGKR